MTLGCAARALEVPGPQSSAGDASSGAGDDSVLPHTQLQAQRELVPVPGSVQGWTQRPTETSGRATPGAEGRTPHSPEAEGRWCFC